MAVLHSVDRIVCDGCHNAFQDLISHVALSGDGECWSTPLHHSWHGANRTPCSHRVWTDPGVMIPAPAVLRDGDRWAETGRSQQEDLPAAALAPAGGGEHAGGGTHHTSVGSSQGGQAVHQLTVCSAGDCSYPGLVRRPPGQVLMSCCSQHERLPPATDPPTPADVFLACFEL